MRNATDEITPASSGAQGQKIDDKSSQGWRGWFKRHQTIISIASGLLVVVSYQLGQANKQSTPAQQPAGLPAPTTLPPPMAGQNPPLAPAQPMSPPSQPVAREQGPESGGGRPWPQPGTGAGNGSAPIPAALPADVNGPSEPRPWPTPQIPREPAQGQQPQGQRPQGQQMAWFDDSGVRWDVTLSPDGRFSGRIADGQPYTLRGSIAENSMNYQILDGNGQAVGQGSGVMKDQTHLEVKVSNVSGQVVYQGQLHINHPPSR